MEIEKLKEAYRKMGEARDLLAGGPFDYTLNELVSCYELLMSRFSPFKVGDRIELSKTPKITPQTAPGWMSAKCFLIKGAKGTVVYAECGSIGFRYLIEFDNESWISSHDNEVRPIIRNKGRYNFSEEWLTLSVEK